MPRPLSQRLVCLCFVASFATGAIAQGQDPAPFDVQRFTLSNGLKVVFDKDESASFVTLNVTYDVGAFDETQTQAGMVRLWGELFELGTKSLSKIERRNHLRRAGAPIRDRFVAGFDFSYSEVRVPKENIASALWVESERMASMRSTLDDSRLAQAKKALFQKRNRQSLHWQIVFEALFDKAHPYRTQGWPNEKSIFDLDALAYFYDLYFAPSNATLVLSGNFDDTQAKKQVEKYFETLNAFDAPALRNVDKPSISKRVVVESDPTQSDFSRVTVAHTLPFYFDKEDADFWVLSALLNDKTHPAHKIPGLVKLEVQQHSFTNSSLLTLHMVLDKSASIKDALSILEGELDLIADLPPERDAIDRAKQELKLTLSLKRSQGPARTLLLQRYLHALNRTSGFDEDLERIDAVNEESLADAASKYLSTSSRVIVIESAE